MKRNPRNRNETKRNDIVLPFVAVPSRSRLRAGRGRRSPRACLEDERTRNRSSVETSRALLTGDFSGVFAKREKMPKIYEIRGFSNFAGNAPKLSKITGKLPENLDWGGPV